MEHKYESMLNELKDYLKDLEYLNSSIAVLQWDSMVNMPSKAISFRSEVLGYLSEQSYKLTTSDKIKRFVDFFKQFDNLDPVTSATIQNIEKEYNKTKKIPADEYKEYMMAASISTSAWEEAKNKADFSIFAPHLKKMIDFNKRFASYWGFETNKYNALLDLYEPGITTEKLDEVFGELRDAIVQLLTKIKSSSENYDKEIFKKKFAKEEQEEFGKIVLDKMGYDYKEAGRIDESTHPFTTNFGNKDVRITTNYCENDFRSALFSLIHEGGHAIYEQNIPDDLQGSLLATGASMGVHESQSRFYENIIGKSRAFWRFFYPITLEKFKQFEGVSFEQFYDAINIVEPSLIRTEADELTYSLHIIIRYEIEKMLFDGEVTVEELPKIWSEKYMEYLGVMPKNDSEGILQDMHWSDGSFGYFPSYALGNLYGTQFLYKMQKDIPNIYDQIEKGNLKLVYDWLKENIHKHGAIYKPAKLVKIVTGEELSAKYFINYINKKFMDIYKL